jgi:hypothetical protein
MLEPWAHGKQIAIPNCTLSPEQLDEALMDENDGLWHDILARREKMPSEQIGLSRITSRPRVERKRLTDKSFG